MWRCITEAQKKAQRFCTEDRREEAKMKKIVNFMAGLLLGGLVGAAAALLLAPRSGAETRRLLRERIEEVVEEARRAAAERRAELEAQFAAAKRVKTPEG